VVARFSVPLQTGPGTHPASCTMVNASLFREQGGKGLTLTTHPHLAPRLKKEFAYTSTLPLGLRGLL